MGVEEAEEAALELASCRRTACIEDKGSEVGGASFAGVAGDQGGERCRAGEDGGEVEQRSGRRADGDAVFGRHLVGRENGAVRTQRWAGVQGPRRDDVDPGAARVADAP